MSSQPYVPDPPEGYRWTQLPGDVFGLGVLILGCARCGAMIADKDTHEEWHAKERTTT